MIRYRVSWWCDELGGYREDPGFARMTNRVRRQYTRQARLNGTLGGEPVTVDLGTPTNLILADYGARWVWDEALREDYLEFPNEEGFVWWQLSWQ